jgi:hypothetical protein
MNANLSKKSEKSLIFLIWKQRLVINDFARQIKSLLAEKREFENLKSELRMIKAKEEAYQEIHHEWADYFNKAKEKCREQAKEIAYLKSRLNQKKGREASND